jgi:excisionase family DNA binding protein
MTRSVDDLLTTRQLQDLLQVDRVTIYRMLSDGRLRGFKVGGQWRFSRQGIDAWLQNQQSSLNVASTSLPAEESPITSSRALPLSCVGAIQGVCAEALEIGSVTVDLDGAPLTNISNSCDFCNLILSSPEGRRRCALAWKSAGNGQIHSCHAGLLCASVPIRVGGRAIAIAAGCQFVQQGWRMDLAQLAVELGLEEGDLQAAAGTVRIVPADYLPRVSRLLRRIAETFSEIGEERLGLLSRLQHISEMSRI